MQTHERDIEEEMEKPPSQVDHCPRPHRLAARGQGKDGPPLVLAEKGHGCIAQGGRELHGQHM